MMYLTFTKPLRKIPIMATHATNFSGFFSLKLKCSYKKVLLRERKRHTARRVVSTHSVVLSWLTPPGWLTPLAGWPPPSWLTSLTGWPRPCWLTPPTGWPPLLADPPPLPADLPPPPAESADWPPPVDRQNHGWMDRHVSKHYLPVVLRTRAV